MDYKSRKSQQMVNCSIPFSRRNHVTPHEAEHLVVLLPQIPFVHTVNYKVVFIAGITSDCHCGIAGCFLVKCFFNG